MAYQPLPINDENRVRVSTLPGDIELVTGNITAVAGTVSADVSRASNLNAHCVGTFAGSNCTFEGSIDGGTTWFAIQAVRTNANTVETTTGALSAAPAYAWELSVNALTNVRVRATAFTSGTQSWNFKLGSYATEPIPAVQTHAVTLTTTSVGASTSAAGVTLFRNTAINATDTAIKTTTNGRLYFYYLYNGDAADVWVHFYNASTANVTVGTTTPLLSVLVKAGQVAQEAFMVPVAFATALTVASTTTLTGNTSPTVGTLVEVGYI